MVIKHQERGISAQVGAAELHAVVRGLGKRLPVVYQAHARAWDKIHSQD